MRVDDWLFIFESILIVFLNSWNGAALLYDWKPMDISEYIATGSQSDAKRYECLKRTLLNFNFRPLDDVQYFFACFLKLKQNPSWLQLCDRVGIAWLLNETRQLSFHFYWLFLFSLKIMVIGWFNYGGSADVCIWCRLIQHMIGFDKSSKRCHQRLKQKEPVQVDCSKRKGQFFFSLIFFCLCRYPLYARAALCLIEMQ